MKTTNATSNPVRGLALKSTRPPHPRLSAFICGLFLLSPLASAQTLYKCVQPNGRILYQQEPCADPARQSTVRPPDARAAKTDAELAAIAERDAKAADAQMGRIIQVIADVSVCVNDSPGFDAKYGPLFQDWKARNGTQVARFDADRDARQKAIARAEGERARFKAEKSPSALAAHCEQIAAALRAPAPSK